MKTSTMNKILTKKANEFIESIESEAIRKMVQEDLIITGGCITSMFLKEEVNDFDMYFKSKETTFALANYYSVKMMEEGAAGEVYIRLISASGELFDCFTWNEQLGKHTYVKVLVKGDGQDLRVLPTSDLFGLGRVQLAEMLVGIERVEIYVPSQGQVGSDGSEDADMADYVDVVEEEVALSSFRPVFMTAHAITLSDKVQLILRFTGTVEEIHSNFDFVHATNYWTFDDGVVVNQKALTSILSRELIYVGSLYPLASIFRTRKFIQRGWTVHVANYIMMAMQLSEMDLTDVKVLEEQLTGVDSAYLGMLISAVKENQERNPDFKLSSTYVCTLCEKMMG